MLRLMNKYFIKYNKICRVMREHHIICSQIKLFNIFWQKYYSSLIITLIPINILLLTMILFTELESFTKLLFLTVVIYTWVFIFFISFCASQVSKGIHLSYNRLFVSQFSIKTNIMSKLKLMAFIEKLLSNRLIIGFSISGLFVMTFPKLSFVSICLLLNACNVTKYL